MITLTEIQNRFESAILSLSQQDPLNPRAPLPQEVKLLANVFKRSRMTNVQIKPEELVVALMNILVLASEVGIDLESKTLEVLADLEKPSYFSS